MTPSCAKSRPARNANDSGRVEAGIVVAFGLPLACGRAYAGAGEHVAASVSDLDEPRPAGPHRIPARGEPRATPADGRRAPAVHGRSAPSPRSQGQEDWSQRALRDRHPGDSGHVASMVREADRQEIRFGGKLVAHAVQWWCLRTGAGDGAAAG